MHKVLVIGAHPDDETLGCGGTIAKLSSQGIEVICMHLSDYATRKYFGDAVRSLGGRVIAAELPVFSDQEFDTMPIKKIITAIETAVEIIKPDTVLTHTCCDLNRDHRIVFEASLVACRPPSGVKNLYTYAVPDYSLGSETFKPNIFVDIGDFIELKMSGFRQYVSEIRDWPLVRSEIFLRTWANYWGSKVGVDYAEAFQLIRGIL